MPVPAGLRKAWPTSYTTEINLAAARWIEDWSKVLGSGLYVLLADYGYPRDVLLLAGAHAGDADGVQDHHKSFEIRLQAIGLCDLTAHVDFTTLAERAEASGMQLTGYCDQHHFSSAGREELMKIERSLRELTPELLHFIRSFKTLMHPATMGMAFKFIGFSKNIPAGEAAVGLQPVRRREGPRSAWANCTRWRRERPRTTPTRRF